MFRGTALWFAGVMLGLMFLTSPAVSDGQEKKEEPKTTLTLVIDYGDGVAKHFTRIPWKKGATVLSALQAAQGHPRGIKLVHRGQGETAFVSKIDDLENQGAEHNWLYRVNGKVAKESCGVRELSAGDVVLWRYE